MASGVQLRLPPTRVDPLSAPNRADDIIGNVGTFKAAL